MMPRRFRRGVAALVVCTPLIGSACVNSFYSSSVREVDASRTAAADTIAMPLKVHLLDGGTVMFRGAIVTRTAIRALPGQSASAYALLDTVPHKRDSAPVDSVVGVEVFEEHLLTAPTVVVSAGATVLGAVGSVALFKAIFGSCPTVYADTGGALALQAEGFSNAIAPLFEHRDLDRLRVAPGPDGVIRLELRNEALETHYINLVGLVAVRHPAALTALPDQLGRAVLVGALREPITAVDRAGRDVLPALRAVDGDLFASDTAAAAAAPDLRDWIDLDVDGLPPGDSVAVVFHMRNSLLNTVLLYDGMLRGGAAAGWLGRDLGRPMNALALAQWYIGAMGMNVSAGTARVHVVDKGPIAFRDLAVVLPRPEAGASRVRIRVEFPRDNWRIDRIQVAGIVRPAQGRPVSLSDVVAAGREGPVRDATALAALLRPDTLHLQTLPGQRMTLEFRAPPAPPGDTAMTTWFIDWQGWYSEWLRPEWLTGPRQAPFVPGEPALAAAMRRWQQVRGPFERAFYSSRIGAP